MFLDQPAIHDVLADYIGPKHNLHIVNANLRNIYGSPFFQTQGRHKGHEGYVVLPSHVSKFSNKVTSLIAQECFAIDMSRLDCFERVVYSEEDRSRSAGMFTAVKPSILPCVERIYIDCHWLGYIVTTHTADGNWTINPMYEKWECPRIDALFDFEAYDAELNLYLTGWSNLKEVHLFKPYRNDLFLKCLYARTKRIVDEVKARSANPHHLKIEEICNEGLNEIESIENSFLFLKNVDTRVTGRDQAATVAKTSQG